MRPEKSLIICTLPRSGSYMLCDGLSQIGTLGHPAEYFSVAHDLYYDRLIGKERAQDYNVVFDYILRMGMTGNGLFSVKLLYHQMTTIKEKFARSGSYADLTPLQIVDRLTVDPHYVYLVRRDKLRQAISYYRAIKSGVWWEFEGYRTAQSAPAEYDHAAIDFWVRVMSAWEDAWVRELTDLGKPLLALDYDEMVSDYSGTMAKVYSLLGMPMPFDVAEIRPKLRKQSDATSRAWAERFLKIEAAKRDERLVPQTSSLPALLPA